MTPVRVTFQLRTPMVTPPGPKTLDAVLSWAAVRRAEFEGASDPIAHQHATGLARHFADDDWCPMASYIEIEWASDPEQIHYIKQQRVETYADGWLSGALKKKPYFDGQRGQTKAGLYVQDIRWAERITAWAVIDDEKTFRDLLPWVTHIGKLHHRDFGAIRCFEVVQDEGARIKWCHRPLPLGSDFASNEHVLAIGGLRSPYWNRSEHRSILSPAW